MTLPYLVLITFSPLLLYWLFAALLVLISASTFSLLFCILFGAVCLSVVLSLCGPLLVVFAMLGVGGCFSR